MLRALTFSALVLSSSAFAQETCTNAADDDADGAVDCADSDCGLDPACCPVDATDADGDGWCADLDVCPVITDPDQADADGNGTGDACEVCANLRPGLIGAWAFDETTGLVASSSIPGTDAILNNFPANDSQWVAGLANGALHFRGSASRDYGLVAVFPAPNDSISFSGWVWADVNDVTWESIAKNWGDTVHGMFHFGLGNGTRALDLQLTQASQAEVEVAAPSELPVGRWVHVGFTADAAVHRVILYEDGVAVAQVGYDGTLFVSPNTSIGIGVKPNDAGTGPDPANPGYWEGSFDDFGLWDRALTADEMRLVYERGSLLGLSTVFNAGSPEVCDGLDTDCDGVVDNGPGGLDVDSDGIPDACDVCLSGDDALDADADGTPDACDPCPNAVNAGGDSDGDGTPDGCDLCPNASDDLDLDGDGQPDACDPCPHDAADDSDGDLVCDSDDACPGSDDRVDADGDGIPDGCDEPAPHDTDSTQEAPAGDGEAGGGGCGCGPGTAPDGALAWIAGLAVLASVRRQKLPPRRTWMAPASVPAWSSNWYPTTTSANPSPSTSPPASGDHSSVPVRSSGNDPRSTTPATGP